MGIFDRASTAKGPRFLNFLLWILMAIFWIIWLAGIATTQDACVKGQIEDFYDETVFFKISRDGTPGNPDSVNPKDLEVGPCGNELSLEWWVLFFHLICISMGVLLALGNSWANRKEYTIIAFFGIATALAVLVAPKSVKEAYRHMGRDGLYSDGRQVTAAGNVALAILDFIFIMAYTDKQHEGSPMHRPAAVPMGGMPPPSYPSTEPPAAAFSNPHYMASTQEMAEQGRARQI